MTDGCEHSHYEGGIGYICKLDKKTCKYKLPDLEKCIRDFKNKITKREMEG